MDEPKLVEPKWMAERGVRAAQGESGRPVPPIGNITVERVFNETRAVSIVAEFRAAIDGSDENGVDFLNAKILDAMTANRISSAQAYRLLLQLFSRQSATPGLSTVDRNGNLRPMDWGNV